MPHNFDTLINNNQQHSVKHDANQQFFGTEDILPLWVADMDFAAPPAVTAALTTRAQHPVYGYTFYPESLYQTLISWFEQQHNWPIERNSILMSSGVVTSLHAIILALTQAGDGIIIQPPVYPPFFSCVTTTKRKLLLNPLGLVDGQYQMDFEHLEHCATQGAKLLILCSPHNPVGRVWTKAELQQLLSITRRHGIVVIADEIHADLVYTPHQHHALATLAQSEDLWISTIAPSKTFNIAGLMLSSLIVPNPQHKQAIQAVFDNIHIGNSNPFSIAAFEAAYTHGHTWLNEVLVYLQANRDFACDYIKQYIPQVQAITPQGTYLLWLDCRNLGLNNVDLKDFFIQQAKLGLNTGLSFGEVGSGFMRLNFALPQSTLKQALLQLKQAIEGIEK
jgi:cysteine-S-conjugate beta-lyase